MSTELHVGLRERLVDRRHRLSEVIAEVGHADDLVALLREVDAALERAEGPEPGRCIWCGEPVEDEVLAAHPAMTWCLCDLSPRQLAALGRDLGQAWGIQAALLPPQKQAIGDWDVHYRYLPAGPVSGDYCDVQPHPSEAGVVYLFVGDVSGKGVAASLVMAHLSALLRNEIRRGAAMQELIRDANAHVRTSVAATHFATLLGARADSTGAVEICNAGHCRPIVVGPQGVSQLDSAGFPLGIVGGTEYDIQRAQLRPGESLVLYSDGLTDAMSPSGTRYGLDALERSLRAHRDLPTGRLLQAVLDDVSEHGGGEPRPDDVTLMVARFDPRLLR
jgi:sigma-B regulation protein RsbU (phosphoserine phosphatase)